MPILNIGMIFRLKALCSTEQRYLVLIGKLKLIASHDDDLAEKIVLVDDAAIVISCLDGCCDV